MIPALTTILRGKGMQIIKIRWYFVLYMTISAISYLFLPLVLYNVYIFNSDGVKKWSILEKRGSKLEIREIFFFSCFQLVFCKYLQFFKYIEISP